VGNKIDLDSRRVISEDMGDQLAQQFGIAYYECSSVSFTMDG
jgi:GTPase SAR1 family protein